MTIRGDSSEYELLRKWCDTLPFFEEPKSVTTCEVGVREGLGSKIIMMSLVPRIKKAEYQHYAIDPYNNLEYTHFDNHQQWKKDGKWTSEAPKYSNEMRDQMVKDFAGDPHYKFFNMTDIEYMDIFNLSRTTYDLVFLDGPHTTKAILKESLWFAERSRKGSRIIIDDFNLCNFDLIKAAISYWDFKVLESGKNKVCFQKEI
jgi:hypothetical protein|tara:strand:+ start:667 stop:1272 length:606 start_codon:yes stop_codon:yes gene_type:complete